jgi:glucose/arabinose dehydrogenase
MLCCLAIAAPAAPAGSAPPGFVVERVVGELDAPAAVSFADDGRMFVVEKGGVIRVFANGRLLPTPFIDLSAEVNNYHEHGLLGMTLHPDFPAQPYLYVLYTYDPPGVAKDAPGGRVARVERITANANNTNVAAAGPGMRTVLLGRNADASAITDPNASPSLTCWRNGARVEDCIPQDSRRHAIGTLAFGPDGALYLGNGDSDRLPGGPHDPANHIGSILRINPTTGGGLPTNPFYDGNPASNVSKTWAHGLKNPFRFSIDPVSGQMFIADVGAQSWEAIHLGQAGKNYGWPCYEGGSHVYGTYQNTGLCQSVYAQGPRTPIYTYQHTAAGGSVTGGDWYHGAAYPPVYRGKYFFADYAQGWVKYLEPNGSGGYTASPFLDDGGAGGTTAGIVQLTSGPNGDLYWVSITNGGVYRLRYGAGGAPTPSNVLSLDFEKRRGKVAIDSSGNGNGARLRKGAGLGRGQLGRNLALDGVNDFASVPNSPTLGAFTDELTVAGWTRRPSKRAGWRALVSRQLGGNAPDQFFLGFKDGVPKFGVNTSNGAEQSVGSGEAPRKEWVHLAGVYDGSRMTLYVNGEKRANVAKSGNLRSSARPVLVGANANRRSPLAASQNLNGGVDEVRLYTRALSAAQIDALATLPPRVTIKEPDRDTTVRLGTRVRFKASAKDPVDGNLTSRIVWKGTLHHGSHTHPDVLPPTTGARGSFVLGDHADDTFVEICAEVTNPGGRSDADCFDVRPRTTKVKIRSVPVGRVVSFAELSRATPYTVEANVGARRTLSAPIAAGCFAFERWSDGGAATHQITVPAGNPTYTARFGNTCG